VTLIEGRVWSSAANGISTEIRMNEMVVTVLAVTATTLSALSLLPQVIRTWRTRSAGDISGTWLIVALLSMAMWIAYGGITGAHAILWANLITGLQATVILGVKLHSSRKPYAEAGLRTDAPSP
jgi:MtN3 and saliva related transmembrane protein